MAYEIDGIVDGVYSPPGDTGLVVGVSEAGRSSIHGYGEKSGAGSGPPDRETLFEIGSVTKVFTMSLLSLLVRDGALGLDDPVREVCSRLPRMHPGITLRRLATHTSGLPKMPPDAFWAALRNRSNPYADYAVSRLMEYLSKQGPRLAPSEVISYSNMGVALLGHILAENMGSTYGDAVKSGICDELGMGDTGISLNREQMERFATPHTGKGRPSSPWEMPAFAGAGALRSTAEDMLRFIEAHIGRQGSQLADAFKLTHERQTGRFPSPGPLSGLVPGVSRRRAVASSFTRGIGLGWMIGEAGEGGPEAHWHHGATGGFIAFAGFVKEADAGVVVMINRGPRLLELVSGVSAADEMGFRVLRTLCS